MTINTLLIFFGAGLGGVFRFNEDEIIELTASIAFENLSSKFNAALAIPAQGLCQLPQNNDKK